MDQKSNHDAEIYYIAIEKWKNNEARARIYISIICYSFEILINLVLYTKK